MAESKSGSTRKRKNPSAGEHQYSDDAGTAFIDGLTFYSKPVQYVVVDGMALVEGDINLGPVDQVKQHTEMRRAELAGGPVAAGVVISGSQFRWPNCTIPYQIAGNLPNPDRVNDAIAHWQDNTNYTFVLRTSANASQYPDYVEFVPGGGCSSFVGRRGGRQTVTLGSGCTVGNTIHEIGHVVGMWHEQSREDRDTFVTINWANIIPAAVNNFAQHITDGEDVGAYDYDSIMHYPRTAFSSNGQDTIVPTNPSANIGQRNGLSAGDIAAANSICSLPPAPVTNPTLTRFTLPPTLTRITFTRPTLTRITQPTLTNPTFTRPTLTNPTLTNPTLTNPTLTRIPFTRTAPPVTFTRIPFTRTAPPVTFTRPPVTLTRPPVTFPPPVTFTRPPVTFPPPVTFTRPPVTLTNPPVTLTNPPVTLTNPPVTFTLPPPPITFGGGGLFGDWYGYGDVYDPYDYSGYDYGSYDPYGYGSYDPYGYGSYDPYGYGSYDPYGYGDYDAYGSW